MQRCQVLTISHRTVRRFSPRSLHGRYPPRPWLIAPLPGFTAGRTLRRQQNPTRNVRTGAGAGRDAAPNAFTLIEVLVVVAIIALLVAILIPSLVEARNQAKAAVCATNLKQGVHGVILAMVEAGMKKEVWSTNFGWAVSSLKQNKGQSDIFTCPADPDPKPVPAVFDRIYLYGRYKGMSSGDAIFNHVKRLDGDRWLTDIQDQVMDDDFGGDSYHEAIGDCLLVYTAKKGQRFIWATVEPGITNRKHDGYSYKGKLLWKDTSSHNKRIEIPVLWMSYGANASAGLKNVKGNPVLLVEAGKLGIFPETFGRTSQGVHYGDHLGKSLRFRHGSRVNQPGLGGVGSDFTARMPQPALATDMHYEPREKMNAAYLDGHVDRLAYFQMFTLNPVNPDLVKPTPKYNVWFGNRPKGRPSY